MPEQMTDGEYGAYAMKAMSHVVAFAQNEIGARAEFYDIGLANSRNLNLENLDEDTAQEFQQVLFSCHVIETAIGPSPSWEFAELVEGLKAHLLPDLRRIEPNA